jgi:predicted hydrocarbon binding protein
MKNAVDLLLGGERRSKSESQVLLMRTDSFLRMIKYFTNNFGATGLTMIYSMGEANGKYETSQMREELKSLDVPILKKQLIEKSLWRITSMGWGTFSLASLDTITGETAINIKINPFSEQCDLEDNGGCYFLQGYIAGVLSEALNDEITYCDPRCSTESDGACQLHLRSMTEQIKK